MWRLIPQSSCLCWLISLFCKKITLKAVTKVSYCRSNFLSTFLFSLLSPSAESKCFVFEIWNSEKRNKKLTNCIGILLTFAKACLNYKKCIDHQSEVVMISSKIFSNIRCHCIFHFKTLYCLGPFSTVVTSVT